AVAPSVGDSDSASQLMVAPVYVNASVDGGRVTRVTMRADAGFRDDAGALAKFYAPRPRAGGEDGTPRMVPLSDVVDYKWEVASPSLTRYNVYAAVEIVCQQAPGPSSGE